MVLHSTCLKYCYAAEMKYVANTCLPQKVVQVFFFPLQSIIMDAFCQLTLHLPVNSSVSSQCVVRQS